MGANKKVSPGLVVFLVVAALVGIFTVVRPDVVHRITTDAYPRDPLRRIKPLADFHRSSGAVTRIRLIGVLLLVLLAWVTSVIMKSQ